jgi:holo-[acyl-carrier protein] synthase
MITTGVDIIEIWRVQRVVERWGQRFLDRIFTEAEQSYCKCRVPNLAARFAAKEATMTALGTGVRGVSWKDIEVVRAKSGAPSLRLCGRALERYRSLGICDLALSLSHSRDYAVAMVVGNAEF